MRLKRCFRFLVGEEKVVVINWGFTLFVITLSVVAILVTYNLSVPYLVKLLLCTSFVLVTAVLVGKYLWHF